MSIHMRMGVVRKLLYPFSLIYFIIVSLRNLFFDRKIFKSTVFDLPVIGIGNLTVGGTGKTPTIEYLVVLLKKKYSPATLSRGYGRKTTGMLIADKSSDAKSIGDEPFQFFNKFGNEVTVCVAEDRAYAIPHLLNDKPETDIILLDDAFQHRSVNPSLNILLTEFGRPYFNDSLLPAGNLREPAYESKRADLVVVTKCPSDLDISAMENLRQRIYNKARKKLPVYFTSIAYGIPKSLSGNASWPNPSKLILVTAIANYTPWIQHLGQSFQIIKHFKFRDHHYFTAKEINSIQAYFKQNGEDSVILTTEKDAMRLLGTDYRKQLSGIPVFYQPISYEFIDQGSEFDEKILEVVRKFAREKEG